MRKKIIAAPIQTQSHTSPGWLDLAAVSRVWLTSEDARHPIESALHDSPSTGWRAAQPGEQTIWISFDGPQSIRQISVGFTITEARTHEFLLSWSGDGGASYREIVRQQFNFSATTPREDENYFPNLAAVTDLKLVIRPDISNDRAHATLRQLRLR
jgi:hypothetical protein